jgi:hypothetical protein
MRPGAQNMKTGPDAIGTAQNGSESAKQENGNRRRRYRKKLVRERKTRKRDLTPSVPPKMSHGAQNIKSGLDAIGIVENESGSAKHETEPDALGTAEIESWSAKHENRTRRPR